jgi:ferredoxin
MQADTTPVAVTVDHTRCVGVGLCEQRAPEAFRVSDGDGFSYPTGVLVPRSVAQEAVDRCPTRAISLVEPAAANDE